MSGLIVLLAFLILGRVIYGQGLNSWRFVKVFATFVSLLVGNAVVMVSLVVFVGLALLHIDNLLPEDSGDFLFTNGDVRIFMAVLFLFIVLTAVVHFWLRRPFLQRFKKLAVSLEEYEICEYFIQWSTIYLAVYQFIFQGLNSALGEMVDSASAFKAVSFIFVPENLNLLIQPLLIAAWIIVVIEKYRLKHGRT